MWEHTTSYYWMWRGPKAKECGQSQEGRQNQEIGSSLELPESNAAWWHLDF